MNVTEYLTQGNFFVVAGAIYLLPLLLRKVPLLKKVLDNQWVVRLMPLWPLAAGIGATWLPGAVKLADGQIGTRLVAGIWMGALAMVGHKVLGQTILGDDPRIKSLAVTSLGQNEAVLKE
jgi:hypothetical protein